MESKWHLIDCMELGSKAYLFMGSSVLSVMSFCLIWDDQFATSCVLQVYIVYICSRVLTRGLPKYAISTEGVNDIVRIR